MPSPCVALEGAGTGGIAKSPISLLRKACEKGMSCLSYIEALQYNATFSSSGLLKPGLTRDSLLRTHLLK